MPALNRGGGAPVIRMPGAILADPTSAVALQLRRDFITQFLTICPDTRLLLVPLPTDTTTSTSVDRNARTVTYDATIASRIGVVGSATSVSYTAASSQYATIPDAANLSFGDGTNDSPFSIVVWQNQTTATATQVLLSKRDTGASAEEWVLYNDTNSLELALYDNSAGPAAIIVDATALATGSWLNIAATYDGSRANSGMKLYSAAALLTVTPSVSGTYVAMENLASAVMISGEQPSSKIRPFNGLLGPIALVAKELTIDDLWALKQLGNGYLGLTL